MKMSEDDIFASFVCFMKENGNLNWKESLLEAMNERGTLANV